MYEKGRCRSPWNDVYGAAALRSKTKCIGGQDETTPSWLLSTPLSNSNSLTSLERFAEEVTSMSAIRFVEPVVRFCAVITRHKDARKWAIARLAEQWGQATVCSVEIPFEAGGYYTPSMGSGLHKSLIAVADFADPGSLADWKNETNEWEQEYTRSSQHEEDRPLNLDPGYMTQAKLVLATTKDRDHRLYLRDGMFAEVTLTYVGKAWQHHRWTYPSYRTDEVATFANQCRADLRQHLKETRQFRSHP